MKAPLLIFIAFCFITLAEAKPRKYHRAVTVSELEAYCRGAGAGTGICHVPQLSPCRRIVPSSEPAGEREEARAIRLQVPLIQEGEMSGRLIPNNVNPCL